MPDRTTDGPFVRGIVASGVGQASSFTSLPWVAHAFAKQLGFSAWPGTFNLRVVEADSLQVWKEISSLPGIEIEPPDSSACVARCYRVEVNHHVPGAIVLPHVAGYPPDQIEVVAAQSIRSALGLHDGDAVSLRMLGPTPGQDP